MQSATPLRSVTIEITSTYAGPGYASEADSDLKTRSAGSRRIGAVVDFRSLGTTLRTPHADESATMIQVQKRVAAL